MNKIQDFLKRKGIEDKIVDYDEANEPLTPSYIIEEWEKEQLRIGGVMPRSLTAENGGKALLIGEFKETYEAYDETEGHYNVNIPVQWTTIKDIYKKIVAHYGA